MQAIKEIRHGKQSLYNSINIRKSIQRKKNASYIDQTEHKFMRKNRSHDGHQKNILSQSLPHKIPKPNTKNQSQNSELIIKMYEAIVNLTQAENQNLKQQNAYLIQKLKDFQRKQEICLKVSKQAKYYKYLYEQVSQQLKMIKQQCFIYKQQAKQMKTITQRDILRLQKKIKKSSKIDYETDTQNSDLVSFSGDFLELDTPKMSQIVTRSE